MTKTYAFFSIFVANRDGSSLYRRAGGGTLNVTRTSTEREGKGPFPHDEKFLGEVIAEEDGGCVRGNQRVPGI